MKKLSVVTAILIVTLCFFKTEEVIIPNDSIRFRVIANSNSIKDQLVKKEIVNTLNNNLTTITSNNTIEEVRDNIKKELPIIKENLNTTIKQLKYNKNIDIDYGQNYFPEKYYKGVLYPAGNYESLVIKIGDGIGKNFWCVLFPPLCNIDEDITEYEYTTLIKEIIKKYKE